MNLNKIYYDTNCNAKNILQLVKCEPEWAANIIQDYESKLANIEPRLALMREMADLIKIVISDDIYGDNRLGKEFKSILTRYKEMTKS